MVDGIVIVGAGIAGLLAAKLLHHHRPVVVEAQPSLPNNHSAVLRFRTPDVGNAVNIDFRRVSVIRSTQPWYKNEIGDALAYSVKNTGLIRSDRSITRGPSYVERWIAPHDFVNRLADGADIRYGVDWVFANDEVPVISTIPMPALAAHLGGWKWPHPEPKFVYQHGTNVLATVENCDAYVSLYVPSPAYQFSRVSLTGDQLIIECPIANPDDVDEDRALTSACDLLGISLVACSEPKVIPQPYAKILPIDEAQRRDFIYQASTIRRRAFSLGRFATWRPTLLADDLIKDIKIIDRMIKSRSLGFDAEKLERDRP